MEEEDEFCSGLILPTLLVQIKKILEQYPDDSQILKVRPTTILYKIKVPLQSEEFCSESDANI